MTNETYFDAAHEHLKGKLLSEEGVYRYYDDATRSHWDVKPIELTALGAALKAGIPDAYSRWCSSIVAKEVAQ